MDFCLATGDAPFLAAGKAPCLAAGVATLFLDSGAAAICLVTASAQPFPSHSGTCC
jgi:hypothetical protein